MECCPAPSLEYIANELRTAESDQYGIMPYYNIMEGLVQETLDTNAAPVTREEATALWEEIFKD